MKKIFFVFTVLVLLSSHTMFLKLDNYFLEPNTPIALQLFNGTFEKSENVIDRDRMLDASILSNGKRRQVLESQWTEQDSATILNFQTGKEGTYVVGISTKARSLEMDAESFNEYLHHEGILDVLEQRKKNGELASKAVEKYSKHVKTIFQVGEIKTNDWRTELGYPIEFIPLNNPYALHTGDSLELKLLFKGSPLANQLVYADYKGHKDAHSHNETEENHGHSHKDESDSYTHEPNSEQHSHTSGQKLRTNAEGIIKAHLSADGIWYFQTIHLTNSKEEGLTHESNWSTLTFEVTHAHGEDIHTHNDEHETGYGTYLFLALSIIIVGALFFWFNRKNNGDKS